MGFTTGAFGEVGGGKGGLKNGVVEHIGACAGRLEVTPCGVLVVSMMSVRITT